MSADADVICVAQRVEAEFNSINVDGRAEYLLVESGTAVVHLARLLVPHSDGTQAAIGDPSMFRISLSPTEWERLLTRMWSSKTLCGRSWWIMSSGARIVFGP